MGHIFLYSVFLGIKKFKNRQKFYTRIHENKIIEGELLIYFFFKVFIYNIIFNLLFLFHLHSLQVKYKVENQVDFYLHVKMETTYNLSLTFSLIVIYIYIGMLVTTVMFLLIYFSIALRTNRCFW